MPLDPLSASVFAFIEQVDSFYASFMGQAHPAAHLGGHLFYAGELTDQARAAITAANIAGAATLSVSADQFIAKQAMRDGVVDFLVNSLDEALRILKNEVRKHETVAVCVTAGPQAIEDQMRDRGVRPDLTLAAPALQPLPQAGIWLTLRPTQSPALWLPKLDALALEILPPSAEATRRWLERATRYLGRQTRNLRVLRLTQQQANDLIVAIRNLVATGTMTTPTQIDLGPWGNSIHQPLVPNP